MKGQVAGEAIRRLVAPLVILAATGCTSEPWVLWTETQTFIVGYRYAPPAEPKSYTVMKAYASKKECESAKEARLAEARKQAVEGHREFGQEEMAKIGQGVVVGADGVVNLTSMTVGGVSVVSMSTTRFMCLPQAVDPRPKH